MTRLTGGTVRCFANDLALLRGALANQSRQPRRARWRGARSNPLAPSLPFATKFQGWFRLLPGLPSDVPLVSATLHLSKASARPRRKANLFLGVLTTPLLSRAFEVGDSQSPSSSIRKCSVPRKLFVHPSTVGGRQKRRVIFMS